LGESDPCDGFANEKDPTKKLSRRLYAVMSNQHAMNRLISLWRHWCNHPEDRAAPKLGAFKKIFIHLKDIRRWGVKDRIAETRVVDYWQENLEYETGTIRFEVELWCRGDRVRRDAAFRRLKQIIEGAGGQCVSYSLVPDVSYFGVLAELPAAEVRDTV